MSEKIYQNRSFFGNITRIGWFYENAPAGSVFRWFAERRFRLKVFSLNGNLQWLQVKCTITLEYVALQLGLPIDDCAVTGTSKVSEPAMLCYHLLRRSSDDGGDKFTSLRFLWLKGNFKNLLSSATEREMMCVAWAYILHLIGGVLMLNTNNNKAHLMYLPLSSNLTVALLYS